MPIMYLLTYPIIYISASIHLFIYSFTLKGVRMQLSARGHDNCPAACCSVFIYHIHAFCPTRLPAGITGAGGGGRGAGRRWRGVELEGERTRKRDGGRGQHFVKAAVKQINEQQAVILAVQSLEGSPTFIALLVIFFPLAVFLARAQEIRVSDILLG